MEIVVPALIIVFIVSLVLIPQLLDMWFMQETDKMNFKKEDKEHITEEIADCLVLINQFKAFYQIKDKDIQKVYDYKIARQEERMKNE